MNPEEHLQRTRAPEPPPFLRRNILDHAEQAWADPVERNGRAFVVRPLAAVAALILLFGIAALISEVDRQMTISLAGSAAMPAAAEAGVPDSVEAEPYYRVHEWMWNEAFLETQSLMAYRDE